MNYRSFVNRLFLSQSFNRYMLNYFFPYAHFSTMILMKKVISIKLSLKRFIINWVLIVTKLSQKLIALSFTDNYRFLTRNFKANFDQDKIIVPAFVIWYLPYIDFRPFGPTLPLWICPRMRFLVTQWMRLFFLFVFFFFFFFFFFVFFFDDFYQYLVLWAKS